MNESRAHGRLAALGVVVPAHNEAERLPACLRALHRAALHPATAGITVRALVVLDACRDRSANVVAAEARRWARIPEDARPARPAPTLRSLVTTANNVGAARAAGCAALVRDLRELRPETAWLASTDGDSAVPPQWLAHQVGLHRRGVQAWAGTIVVDDGGEHSPEGLQRFRVLYRGEGTGDHPHEHGTNLGFTVAAYQRSGGFRPLPTGEDRDLLRRMRDASIPVVSGIGAPVRTSSRRDGRAPHGFAATLEAITAL